MNTNQPQIQIVEIGGGKQKKNYGYVVLLTLIVSIVFAAIPQTFESLNGRIALGVGDRSSTTFWSYVLFLSAISWGLFEILMRIYYFFASLSMYTFVIPKKSAHETLRLSFAVRNFFVGGIRLLLFVSPIFINYIPFLTLLLDFATLCLAFWILKKRYLGELLAPFAWRAFVRPFVVYEVVMIAVSIGGLA